MGILQMHSCLCYDLKTGNIIVGVINAVLCCALIGVMGYCTWLSRPGGLHDSPIGAFLSDVFFGLCFVLIFILLVKFIVDLIFLRAVMLGRLRIINIYVNLLLAYFFILILSYFIFPPMGGLDSPVDIVIICFKSLYFIFNVFSIILGDSYYNELKKRQEEAVAIDSSPVLSKE